MLSRLVSSSRSTLLGKVASPIFRLDASTSTLSVAPVPARAKKQTPPKARPKRVYPDLIEEELVTTWVKGSGPGGQAINKTKISCSLVHTPTGIRVQCHETRSRELNLLKARRRMQELIDLHENPGSSVLESKWDRERAKKEAKRRKGKRKKVEGGAEVEEAIQ